MVNDQLKLDKDNFENIEEAWKGDLWDRQRLGEQLTQYVDRLQCGAVLALDARWGEGKTWFVRNWAKHLSDTDHNIIYLDAFANDYLDDPFLTIAAEISQAFKDSDEIDESDIEKLNAKTASVLISLAAVIPMIAAKAGMHWIGLGGAGDAFKDVYEQGKEVFDVASDEIASKVKEQIEKKIENHHIEKQTIQDFKKELAQIASQLEKPLVFIIDELDRCRPDFAIRLIERIKHFFDIKNIVFVFVMNKKQLINGIKHIYGYDEESSKTYLEKFIDFEIPLRNKESTLHKTKLNFGIIKDLLRSIGEDSLDVALVFLLSIDKDMSARELKKKINLYALLKKENVENNIFIALGLIKNPRDILRDMGHIAVTILKMKDGNENISGIDMTRLEIDILNELVESKFNIQIPIISEYLQQVSELEVLRARYNDRDYYQKRYNDFLNRYAFKPNNDMQYHVFQNQYQSYIESSIWLED